jgi:uncharacterized protein (DUF2062 family)
MAEQDKGGGHGLRAYADPLLWSLNRHSITGAFGAGIAIAFIPLPVHMITAVLVALYWRINLPVALASTWVVNPFTMVPFYCSATAWTCCCAAPRIILRSGQLALARAWARPVWALLGCLVSAVVFGLLGRWILELVWRSAVRRRFRTRRRLAPAAKAIR